MRLNFTPFVDLFSILAIGLLLIMTATSGTDVVESGSETDDVAILRFYFGSDIDVGSDVDVDPYYLQSGVEVSRGNLDVFIQENYDEPNIIEIVIRGATSVLSELSVGFRIAEVRNPGVLWEVLEPQIVKIWRGQMRNTCSPRRLGEWRDPVVCFGAESCFRVHDRIGKE